ncbi:MAG TPA: pYEATS domain-containing protein, partial [Jiangellaceae bacterium]
VNPPDRTVALVGCENAADGCLVSVDSDATTFAAAVAAFAAGIGLIALLGVRFTSVKAGALELSSRYDATTAGLPTATPQPPPERAVAGDKPEAGLMAAESPVEVELVTGLGAELGRVPVAVASLTTPMNRGQADFLRDYQSARRASQQGWFLIHILGPAKSAGQQYSVAIKVSPHRKATGEVRAARFYLGRAWGHQVFDGLRGSDGRFGVTTEAYGPFLALCEVEFTTGERILLDHYCDFEMGPLVAV